MLSPNGGETLTKNSNFNITWRQSNIDKVWIGYKVGCSLSALSFSLNWIATEVPTSGSQGSYTWNVQPPNMDCSAYNTQPLYKISIIGYKTGYGSVEDQSDATFSIQ